MSNCSNCYNGCTEIVSDRCVKYTGIDVPVLGIQTGDSLSFVEQALITFLVSTLDGTGIKIDLNPVVVCNVVQKYLPTCGDLSIVDISKALIQAVCELKTQLDIGAALIFDIEAPYTTECLTVTPGNSVTHQVVQAVINKVCQLGVDLEALALDLETNYVPIVSTPGHPGINYYIQAYLSSTPGANLVSSKMIPYVAVPYFNPDLSNFSITGAGQGDWENIYLCNGANPGVPDLRGRTLVGATTGMGGGAFNAAVDPAITGNPNYSLGTLAGANQVTLGLTQIPSHTHTATAISTDAGHTHGYITPAANGSATGAADSHPDGPLVGATTSVGNAIIETSVTVNPFGGGLPHPNVQPGYGCYYIIYIP